MSEEYFDVYNAAGDHIGRRLRRECHGNPELIHRAVHVVIFHPEKPQLLLQKRNSKKDIQPGKWDTAVGGHLDAGEDYLTAARREMGEELGLRGDFELKELFDSKIRNDIESEDVRVFGLRHSGPFTIQPSELDAAEFWDYPELFKPENRVEFTPNLCAELDRLRELGYIVLPDDDAPPSGGGQSRRLKTDVLSLIGAVVVGVLFLLALAAPLLANGRPFFIFNGGTGEWSFPFLRYIFAPDTTEVVIEKLFNFLLLYLPLLGVVRLIFRGRWRKTAGLTSAVLLALPFFLVQPRLDKTDYRVLVEQLPSGSRYCFAPIPYGPYELVTVPYAAPSSAHIFGGDQVGRDVASRMLYGGRVSLAVGIGATVIALGIGTVIGLVCGFFGGWVDMAVMRVVEIVICFPTFLLLLILMAIFRDYKFEQSILIVIGVIGLTGWIGVCQLVRGEVLRQRELPYIQSCISSGISTWRTLFRHLLPNVAAPVIITFTFSVAGAILAESTLSFLGFGVQPPTASWGGLLRQAYENPLDYWHLMVIPGAALFFAVCGFNFTGEGLRAVLDPKSGVSR